MPIVVPVGHRQLPGHRHRVAAAVRVIGIADGAFRRRLREQPVQIVVGARDRAAHRVGDLRHPIARVVRVRRRRGVRIGHQRQPVEGVVLITRDLALPIRDLGEMVVPVVLVGRALLQGIRPGRDAIAGVVGVAGGVGQRVGQGCQPAVLVVAERGLAVEGVGDRRHAIQLVRDHARHVAQWIRRRQHPPGGIGERSPDEAERVGRGRPIGPGVAKLRGVLQRVGDAPDQPLRVHRQRGVMAERIREARGPAAAVVPDRPRVRVRIGHRRELERRRLVGIGGRHRVRRVGQLLDRAHVAQVVVGVFRPPQQRIPDPVHQVRGQPVDGRRPHFGGPEGVDLLDQVVMRVEREPFRVVARIGDVGPRDRRARLVEGVGKAVRGVRIRQRLVIDTAVGVVMVRQVDDVPAIFDGDDAVGRVPGVGRDVVLGVGHGRQVAVGVVDVGDGAADVVGRLGDAVRRMGVVGEGDPPAVRRGDPQQVADARPEGIGRGPGQPRLVAIAIADQLEGG